MTIPRSQEKAARGTACALPIVGSEKKAGSMAVRSAEERIDSLERAVRWYRLLFMGVVLLMIGVQRHRIAVWLDHVEDWMGGVTHTSRSEW